MGASAAVECAGYREGFAQAGKEQGLNPQQIAGLAKAFSSFGGGGGDFGATTDVSGGYYGLSGYAGGISDIGYPPFIAPGAEYHADKGSNWVGAFDENYMIPRYQRGTSSVWSGGAGSFFR